MIVKPLSAYPEWFLSLSSDDRQDWVHKYYNVTCQEIDFLDWIKDQSL